MKLDLEPPVYNRKDFDDIIDSFSNEYDFLSNFYPRDGSSLNLVLWGFTFSTAEHGYQFSKPIDRALQLQFLNQGMTPGEAKRAGRQLPQIRPDWEDVKVPIMSYVVFQKFEQFGFLRDKLLETQGSYLEEGNLWHDNFWGNCKCTRCTHIQGKNVLGNILMEVRDYYA